MIKTEEILNFLRENKQFFRKIFCIKSLKPMFKIMLMLDEVFPNFILKKNYIKNRDFLKLNEF